MLVLQRDEGEEVVIGDGPRQIRVVVVGLTPNGVKLGFDGPRDVAIDRLEVRRRMAVEGRKCERSGSGFGPV